MKLKQDSLNVQNVKIVGGLMNNADSYQEEFIKTLRVSGSKIAVSGTVISNNETYLVLDDGSGNITILVNNIPIPNGDYLRVFGRVMPGEDGMYFQADVIQSLSKIDKHAHKKIKEKIHDLLQ
ncbi:MAG: hypothetical protein AABW49_02075 [Nanoarchaeota archaeon]